MRKTSCWLELALATVVLLAGASPGSSWDYPAHRVINQLALGALPTNFPAFVKTPAARERIVFLSGEPDRWRNTADLPFRHANNPDHFLDLDDLPPYGLEPKSLPAFRYDFIARLALERAARPGLLPIDPAKDLDHSRWIPGLLPWTMTEHYAKLKSAFSYLKALEAAGTPDEITNSQANVIYLMGVMGHFVGDGSQPLHTTKHYNGWVGPNPHRYTTARTFHAWIDGGYFAKSGLQLEPLLAQIQPARLLTATNAPGVQTNIFKPVMNYLADQFQQVEPLYELQKSGKLGAGPNFASEGHRFLTGQLLRAAQLLADLWLTAWEYAPPDVFLEKELTKRASEPTPPPPPELKPAESPPGASKTFDTRPAGP